MERDTNGIELQPIYVSNRNSDLRDFKFEVQTVTQTTLQELPNQESSNNYCRNCDLLLLAVPILLLLMVIFIFGYFVFEFFYK
jgi:hypothetical protein